MSLLHKGCFAQAFALSVGLSAGIPAAYAQTTVEQPSIEQKTAETTETEETSETSTAAKLSAEEKELDPFLLGPWSKMTNSPSDPITNSVVINAVTKCKTNMQLSRLRFGPDVEKAFPKNRQELVGDVIYYRTSKGIQILDNRTDTMLLLPEIERKTLRNGDVVWRLSNNRYKVLARFTDTADRGGVGEFMARNDGIYLRCIKRPEVSQ